MPMMDAFGGDAAAAQEDAYHGVMTERVALFEALTEAHDIIAGLGWWINKYHYRPDESCPVCGTGDENYSDEQCALCRADRWLAAHPKPPPLYLPDPSDSDEPAPF